jgi:hypothetical protein
MFRIRPAAPTPFPRRLQMTRHAAIIHPLRNLFPAPGFIVDFEQDFPAQAAPEPTAGCRVTGMIR